MMLQADAKTIRFKDKVIKKGGIWRDIYGIDEKKVASMVREDKVDILVELTGHTANNKLGMMACRPAPVQVCWSLLSLYIFQFYLGAFAEKIHHMILMSFVNPVLAFIIL